MNFRKLVYGIAFFIIAIGASAQSQADIDSILHRYKEFILYTGNHRLPEAIPAMNQGGAWDDIDYENNQPGGWKVADHLRRIKSLAVQWASKESSYYQSDSIRSEIILALKYWNIHRYQSKNWWHNEIGVPQLVRDVLVLMKDELPDQVLQETLEILAQYKLAGTGANLVWSADLGLHYGAFTHNTKLMQLCRDTLLSVITVTTAEGVQPDYSFHQHGKRLQMYHYGGAFLLDDVRLAWQLRHTWIAFPPKKVGVLTDFVLNGWQWMARGINTVPGTIDRAASREDALHSADIRNIIPLLYAIQPDSISAFQHLLKVQQGRESLSGYRYFPYSDFTAYHQPCFSFFLKTTSARTLLTESINGENLKGSLLNSGDGYFISNGNEYFNLLPFWNWNYLPGITNFQSGDTNSIEQQNFVGNVTDGQYGLAVMDYKLVRDEQSLGAKKFWASYKNVTVVLMSDIKTANLDAPPFTVLDQCRWQTDVTLNSPGNIVREGIHTYDHINWVHQNQFVYIPLGHDSLQLILQKKQARWSEINQSESDSLINDSVFMPVMIHDGNDDRSGYVVAYAATAEEAEKIVHTPTWQVIRNDSNCQAVSFKKQVMMAAFYKPCRIKLSDKYTIFVSRPCLLYIAGNRIYLSDPSHSGGAFRLQINHKEIIINDVPADGQTYEVK